MLYLEILIESLRLYKMAGGVAIMLSVRSCWNVSCNIWMLVQF